MDWSWVATEDLVGERREHARQLVGLRLSSVTYVTMDYRRLGGAVAASGPRLVADNSELAAPTWCYETFDSIDYGIELTTVSGEVFTASWDSPGWHEGIWIRKVSALGTACSDDAVVALWDVSNAGRWNGFLGEVVSDVTLHYAPVTNDGYWCSRIDLSISGHVVHLLLGDADQDQCLVSSSDNIAVVFPGGELPE